MGISIHEREIEGVEFVVRELPAKKAVAILPIIMEAVGGAVSALEGELDVEDHSRVGAAIASLARTLDEQRLERVVNAMASVSKVKVTGKDGELRLKDLKSDVVMDEVFAGRMDLFMGWMAFALEVNFSSFFTGLGTASLFGAQPAPRKE